MPDYKIITDSCCDFTDAQYAQLDVTSAPLTFLYKGEVHDNLSDDKAVKEFYDGLRAGETATTSAVNPEGWTKIMVPILEAGKDILALCFSSGLSTTYQSAVIAARELMEKYPGRKINVVDTLCAALGQGLLVWYACKHRDAGMNLEELTAWCEENKLQVCHWVTVDDLNHLKRGGRISATTAFVGGMLHIKPIIYVNDEGKLINTAKCRGRKAAMEYLVKKLAEQGEGCDNETVFIAHGDCMDDAKTLEAMVKASCGVKNVLIGNVGAVIGAHTGPGVLVLFFMGKKR